MSERNSTCSSVSVVGTLIGPTSANGTRDVLGLAAGVAAAACASSRRGPTPEWPYSFSAIPAFGFELSQSDHSSRSQKQQWPQAMVNGTTTRSPTFRLLTVAADLDDLAHELVAEDVAALHGRDEAVVEVQVGAADRGRA